MKMTDIQHTYSQGVNTHAQKMQQMRKSEREREREKPWQYRFSMLIFFFSASFSFVILTISLSEISELTDEKKIHKEREQKRENIFTLSLHVLFSWCIFASLINFHHFYLLLHLTYSSTRQGSRILTSLYIKFIFAALKVTDSELELFSCT